MVAGPVIILVLADSSAVMLATLMSWLIALVLAPMLWRETDWAALGRLLPGAAVGLPFGLWLLSATDLAGLKLLAGAVIGGATAMMIFGAPGLARPGRAGDLMAGGLAGLFGGCLAMPGPTAAIRLAGLGLAKAKVRATMVMVFAVCWPVIFAGQALTLGLGAEMLRAALGLVPATLIGLAAGTWAASRVSERLFRRMVIGFLLATSASLLLASGMDIFLIGDSA